MGFNAMRYSVAEIINEESQLLKGHDRFNAMRYSVAEIPTA